jgi:hypothetical protein
MVALSSGVSVFRIPVVAYQGDFALASALPC